MQVFVDWFNRVWKVPPNAIAAELGKARRSERKIGEWSGQLRGWLDLFERLLEDRGHLLGEDFSAADCVAFPFLKYAALPLPDGDDEVFHQVLRDHQPLGATHPRLRRAIHRVDRAPREPSPSGCRISSAGLALLASFPVGCIPSRRMSRSSIGRRTVAVTSPSLGSFFYANRVAT